MKGTNHITVAKNTAALSKLSCFAATEKSLLNKKCMWEGKGDNSKDKHMLCMLDPKVQPQRPLTLIAKIRIAPELYLPGGPQIKTHP